MTMMDTTISRAKKLIKLIKRLLKQEHLYTEEKLMEMKQQLRILEQEVIDFEAKTSKGFGKK